MDQNPYESPSPPDEAVVFSARGETWRGWKAIRMVGRVMAGLSLLAAMVMALAGLTHNAYTSLAFAIGFFGGCGLILIGRFGAYLHSIVLMLGGEYD